MAEKHVQSISTVLGMGRPRGQHFSRTKSMRTRNFGNLVKVPIFRSDYNNLSEVSTNSDRVSDGKSLKGNERAVPNLMLSNARSLTNKVNELEVLKESYRADLIFVTETWLADTVPDEIVNVSGLNIVRRDRLCGRGGGVAIYVNHDIPLKIRDDLNDQFFECLWVTIRPKWLPRSISRIALGCVYLPPSLLTSEIENFYDYFITCYDKLCVESPNTAIILAGDFNPASNGFQQKRLERHCNLKPIVMHPTRDTSTLDLIFTNMADCYQTPAILAPLSTSDHNIINWKSKCNISEKGNAVKIKERKFRQQQLERFDALLANYDWSSVLNISVTDEKVNTFLHITNNMIAEYFPERTVRMHSKDKPFMTPKIKRLISKRNMAFKRNNTERVKKLRSQISAEIRKAKISFYENKVGPNLKNRPKSWWKVIKRLIGKKSAKATMVDPSTWLLMDDKQSACFIHHFFANLTKDYPKVGKEWLELHCTENLPLITIDEVQQELQKINVNKAPGPNDPLLKILKIFAKYFAVPLTEIFNESFQSKTFPKVWKNYKVSGIPKSIPCTLADDLRPIALTSVLAKIQETYAVKWMYDDTTGKISDSQDDGLPRSSTVNALVKLLHNWHKLMDERHRVIRIVFLDFRKAFDLIDHNKLLENMRSMGVRPALIKWFASYLNERSHFTQFGKETSDFENVTGGVPQGSKLGPIAFVIKINMLPSVIQQVVGNEDVIVDGDTILFMGDTTSWEALDVHYHVSGMEIGNMLKKIESVKTFAENEKMVLNAKKCKEMIIDFRKDRTVIPAMKINDCVLERVSSYKLLGLWIDDDLKWKSNTEYVVKMAAKRLHFLKTLKGYNAPREDLKIFYISAIRSIVEFGAQIWHGGLTQEQSKDIERI